MKLFKRIKLKQLKYIFLQLNICTYISYLSYPKTRKNARFQVASHKKIKIRHQKDHYLPSIKGNAK